MVAVVAEFEPQIAEKPALAAIVVPARPPGLHPPVEPPDLGAGDLHSWVVEQQVPGRRHQRGVRTGARDEHDLKRL